MGCQKCLPQNPVDGVSSVLVCMLWVQELTKIWSSKISGTNRHGLSHFLTFHYAFKQSWLNPMETFRALSWICLPKYLWVWWTGDKWQKFVVALIPILWAVCLWNYQWLLSVFFLNRTKLAEITLLSFVRP